ncbi:MAG TPA: translocation/assembly module TamB domain-containing protein [Novosphingobium sp.]|nr:translocation/assembly module TamB domain-containing protein [Novosphingobium sp.]
MADEMAAADEAVQPAEALRDRPGLVTGWRKYALALPLGVVMLLALVLVVLDSPIGHRLLADAIAANEMDNGLRVRIGRIEGSVYGELRAEGVVLRDPQGVFLRVPEIALDWRPLAWWDRGLDIRSLAIRRGTLLRVPALRSTGGQTKWPDFDIRVDKLTIERLTVAKPVLGSERRVDLLAQAHLARGRARLVVLGKLGGGDRLSARLDAEKARNRFDLALDYAAPRGGLLAALSGANVDRRLRVAGRGTYARWRGNLLAQQDGRPLAAMQLTHRGEALGLAGLVWTDPVVTGDTRAVLGGRLAVVAGGTLQAGSGKGRVFDGNLAISGEKLAVLAKGVIDLGARRVNKGEVAVNGRRPLPIGKGDVITGLRARIGVDGPFDALAFDYAAKALRYASDTTYIDGLVAHGTAHLARGQWTVPVEAKAAAVRLGQTAIDPQLRPVSASGTLHLAGGRLTSDDLRLVSPRANARLTLRGDTGKGAYGLAGELALRGWPLSLGPTSGEAHVVLAFARKTPWRAEAQVRQATVLLANTTLVDLAGEQLHAQGRVQLGAGHFLVIPQGQLSATRLTMDIKARRLADGQIEMDAAGQQARWGSFEALLHVGEGSPTGTLHFVDPLPAAGIKDVTLALSAETDTGALRVDGKGQSGLGPFDGTMALTFPAGAPARLDLRRLSLSNTNVTGAVTLGHGGVDGTLEVAGGGMSGQIALAAEEEGQGVDLVLDAKQAHFGGTRPLTIGQGHLIAKGRFHKHHTTLSGEVQAQGIGKGRLFVGRLGATASLTDGAGRVTANIAGRRGSRFFLQLLGEVAPDRLAVLAGGSFAGQKIAMPARAVFTAEQGENGLSAGWRLAPAEVDFGGGRMVASGVVGNGSVVVQLGLADMPLSLADVVFSDIGLGGKASGQVIFNQQREHLPEGDARLLVKGLSRSGMVLTSRPIDVALAGHLAPESLELRAIASENGKANGRLQARIAQLPTSGTLGERLSAGHLFAQMRYGGPADALWRLMAMDSFDLTGPVSIAADINGSIDAPQIRGSLASDNLRLQSGASGTDITGITARGNFAGGALTLSTLNGHTAGGGAVTGSGKVDFSGMDQGHGPTIDVALSARHAQLIARPDMAFTATGPLRLQSDGLVGIMAGRVTIDNARWRLGQAAAAAALPDITVREVNRRADVAPASDRQMPWRLLVDAQGSGISVMGLGLDSRWRAAIKLRGTLTDPAIAGSADMVEGAYEFAGKRFELTRGHITFDGGSPPDPRLDIQASADVNSLTATVSVRGTSLRPEITFASTPSLPEEELLARILFGSSVSSISAPEAVQLGAALAAMHGGGGLDPINKLRSAIGLDRLRIVDADASQNRQTGVAVGKYLGRRFYAEIVSDGRGYSATNLEFRLTNWLALLGSVASTGRQSVNAKISKDY